MHRWSFTANRTLILYLLELASSDSLIGGSPVSHSRSGIRVHPGSLLMYRARAFYIACSSAGMWAAPIHQNSDPHRIQGMVVEVIRWCGAPGDTPFLPAAQAMMVPLARVLVLAAAACVWINHL